MSDEPTITVRHPAGSTVVIDPRCGGTVHRLSLIPEREGVSPSDLRSVAPAEAILKGDDPIAVGGESPCAPGLFRGRILAPFNDRIAGGVYRWRGRRLTLPANDPDTADAIHGFLYRTALHRSAVPPITGADGETTLELCGALPEEERENGGYPFPLAVSIVYTLRPSEFVLTVRLTNLGEEAAPVAMGWHPYIHLSAADAPPDEYRLRLPAERFFEVDGRLLPTGSTPPVAGTEFDFRAPTAIGGRALDMAFPLVGENPTVSVAGGDRIVHMTPAGAFRSAQIFVPPCRDSIAVEPVSAPADVFNRPELGLITLAGGRSVSGIASIRYARCR